MPSRFIGSRPKSPSFRMWLDLQKGFFKDMITQGKWGMRLGSGVTGVLMRRV